MEAAGCIVVDGGGHHLELTHQKKHRGSCDTHRKPVAGMDDDVKEEEGCISDYAESPGLNLDVMTLKGISRQVKQLSKIQIVFFFFFFFFFFKKKKKKKFKKNKKKN